MCSRAERVFWSSAIWIIGEISQDIVLWLLQMIKVLNLPSLSVICFYSKPPNNCGTSCGFVPIAFISYLRVYVFMFVFVRGTLAIWRRWRKACRCITPSLSSLRCPSSKTPYRTYVWSSLDHRVCRNISRHALIGVNPTEPSPQKLSEISWFPVSAGSLLFK